MIPPQHDELIQSYMQQPIGLRIGWGFDELLVLSPRPAASQIQSANRIFPLVTAGPVAIVRPRTRPHATSGGTR